MGRLHEERRLPGGEWFAEAASIREDLLGRARTSLVAGDPAFLPPQLGIERPFGTMTSGTLASYTNYRYWPELLAAQGRVQQQRQAPEHNGRIAEELSDFRGKKARNAAL